MKYTRSELSRILRHLSRSLDDSNEPRFVSVVGVGDVDVADALRDAADKLETVRSEAHRRW